MARMGKATSFEEEMLELHCEWEDCHHVCNDSAQFYMHVNGHTTSDSSKCPWRECSFVAEHQSRSHVLFHAFHSKLKCYGKNWMQRTNSKPCLLDKQTRNLVPDVPEKFKCLWENCEDCDFENPECFYAHVTTHAEDKATRCGWKDCGSELRVSSKLREHLRAHTQEKKIACPTCGGLFASRTKLGDHIARQVTSVPPGEQELSCSYCRCTFSSLRLLRDHMRHHINHYKCPKCDMTCPTPSALRYHVQCRHSDLRPFACDECDFAAKLAGDLRKHRETQHLQEDKPCTFRGCRYAGRTAYDLRKHVRSEHLGEGPSVYACHLCPKRYSKGHTLSRHLVSQHRFRWPSGHKRFTYCRNQQDLFTLQTVRYESLELAEGVVPDEDLEDDDRSRDSPVDTEASS